MIRRRFEPNGYKVLASVGEGSEGMRSGGVASVGEGSEGMRSGSMSSVGEGSEGMRSGGVRDQSFRARTSGQVDSGLSCFACESVSLSGIPLARGSAARRIMLLMKRNMILGVPT